MKRTALVSTLAIVALSPAVAHAAPAKATKRTLTYDYQAFQAAAADGVGSVSLENPCDFVKSCWDFNTKKGEKTIKVTIADDSGQPAGFQMYAGDDYKSVTTFCGSGTITVSPKFAETVTVRPSLYPTCAGVPTSGTLTAVITNK